MKPTCHKCGNVHYNFQACPPRQVTPTVQLRRPRDTDWGNRFQTRVVIGDNVYGAARRPIHSETR